MKIIKMTRKSASDYFIEHLMSFVAATMFLFCAVADYFFARAMIFNSDMAQSYNELVSLKSGNIILHGWSLATDNFYLTDLPFYLVGETIFGNSPSLIYLVPNFVFLLFMVAAIAIICNSGATEKQRSLGIIEKRNRDAFRMAQDNIIALSDSDSEKYQARTKRPNVA